MTLYRALVALGLGVMSASSVVAIQIPGTRVSYFAAIDTVNRDNRGLIKVFEVNDTGGQTLMEFVCDLGVMRASFRGKNVLLSESSREVGLFPLVVYQVDEQQLKSLRTAGLKDGDGQISLQGLAFENNAVVVAAFKNAASRVRLTVSRLGMTELTFVFDTRGFQQALTKIKPC
ncbi:hypothetical protein [Deinococcus navajonensis]|uniref:Uncharacterized protein n=1 Tax=Deinococcus navajonensis TaxID=309884 RepID=A0ABV8XNF4_9DEIO